MQNPIGFFDSGVGGTSIWKEVIQLLPSENTLYLADSKYAPYGDKPTEEIIRLSVKNTEKLLEAGAKMIVVACNTATTNAISFLRDEYDIPFIGIEPAIKPAALQSKTKKVGVLATKGTLSSDLFVQTSQKYTREIEVIEVVGTGLVPLIETGDLESPILRNLLQEYLTPMVTAEIDYLVLGCSHYPYLIPLLIELLPSHVKIIDSGAAVAKQTQKILEATHRLNTSTAPGSHTIYTNGSVTPLKNLLFIASSRINRLKNSIVIENRVF